MILLAPALAVYLFHGRRWEEDWSTRLGGLGRGLLLMLVPTLLYLWIPIRAPQVAYSELTIGPELSLRLYEPTFRGFLEHVSGRIFSSAIRTPAEAAAQNLSLFGLFGDELSWPVLLLGALGIGYLARRAMPLLTLTGLSFLGIIAFNLFYSIGDIIVFYIPAFMIWVIWAGMGMLALAEALEAAGSLLTRRSGRFVAPAAVIAVSVLLPLFPAVANYATVDQSTNISSRAWWQEILSEADDGAILVSNDRDDMTPLWYLQYVEGQRRDVTGLFPLILPSDDWSDIGQVVGSALRSGRKVQLIKEMPGLEVKYLVALDGPLPRVIGPAIDRSPERRSSAEFGETIRLSGYDLAPDMLVAGESVRIALYWQPVRTVREDYTTFVHLTNADGIVIAQSDHRPGGSFYPTRLWRPGDMLQDVHVLGLPHDPGRPPFALRVGIYTIDSGLQHLGAPVQIGFVAEARPSVTMAGEQVISANFCFGTDIELKAYKLDRHPGSVVLRLNWRAVQLPSADYTVFVHLVNASGDIVAQNDHQPLAGEAPTSTWPAGYSLIDEVQLLLPPDLATGDYWLLAGLYDFATGKRLAVSDESGAPLGDSAPLGTVRHGK
jgi:hypothetical protein